MFDIMKQMLGKKKPKSSMTEDEQKAIEQANYHCYWFSGNNIIHIFTQEVNSLWNTKPDGTIIDEGKLALTAPTLIMTSPTDAKLFESTINIILKDTMIIEPTIKKRVENLEVGMKES